MGENWNIFVKYPCFLFKIGVLNTPAFFKIFPEFLATFQDPDIRRIIWKFCYFNLKIIYCYSARGFTKNSYEYYRDKKLAKITKNRFLANFEQKNLSKDRNPVNDRNSDQIYDQNYGQKPSPVKARNDGQKLKFCPKIDRLSKFEILVRFIYFGQKVSSELVIYCMIL